MWVVTNFSSPSLTIDIFMFEAPMCTTIVFGSSGVNMSERTMEIICVSTSDGSIPSTWNMSTYRSTTCFRAPTSKIRMGCLSFFGGLCKTWYSSASSSGGIGMCCSACQPIAEANSASLSGGISIIFVESTDSGSETRTSLLGKSLSTITDSKRFINLSCETSSVGTATPVVLNTSAMRSILGFAPALPATALIL